MGSALSRAFPTPPTRRAARLLERNLLVYRRDWPVIFSGFFEPILYLAGIGFGVGSLVGRVSGLGGHAVGYAVFVAPALMASAAMNGAIYDSTFNLFYKLRYARTYDAILVTPLSPADIALGEIAWALARGGLYSGGFVLLMFILGLVSSPLAILAWPAALVIGFAFAGVGSAVTTFLRTWQDFDLVQVVLIPLFLFSATFFPVSVYPPALQALVQVSPLYHAIHLLRGLTTGSLDLGILVDLAYLVAMGIVGVAITSRRLGTQILR
jgi:lipooligosaccharide transport system permease protein